MGPKPTSPYVPQPFLVEGIAAVAEYVRFRPSVVGEIQCVPKARAEVERLLATHQVKIPVRDKVDRKDETSSPIVARVMLRGLEPAAFEPRLKDRQRDLILALDHVQDPRNLGAIARTAAFFGVREIVVPERRQVLLTQAAVATAQGAFALTDLVVVVNLARALGQLKEQGYWIIGTAMDGEPLAKVAGVYEKVVLVLGSEESGLSRQIAELCDRKAAIAGKGGLESLNVSVAAGIFLQAFATA